MSNKKVNTAVAVTDNTFSQTKVSNSVNLNLNQNDILDIAIQDELVVLEKQLEEAEKELSNNENEMNTARENYLLNYCLNSFSKNKDYKKFLEICKLLGIKDPKVRIQEQMSIEKKIGVYHKANFYDYDKPNSYSTVKRSIKECPYNIYIPESIQLTVYTKEKIKDNSIEDDSCVNSDSPIQGTYHTHEGLTTDAKKELFNILKPLGKNIASLREEVFQLNLKIAELERGEKRIKAHILKTSLKKSPEGRAVLNMLEESKKTRLIL